MSTGGFSYRSIAAAFEIFFYIKLVFSDVPKLHGWNLFLRWLLVHYRESDTFSVGVSEQNAMASVVFVV